MSENSKDKIVVLDFGHGGDDPGALFCKGRGTEANWVNNVGLNIYDGLRKTTTFDEKYKLRLTRHNVGKTINQRCEILNKFAQCYDIVDVYSIHANSHASANANGAEIALAPSNKIDVDWATSFLNQYCSKFKFTNRGILIRPHKDNSKQSYYGLQRKTKSNVYVKIIEFGFVSHDSDSKKLWNCIDDIADFTANFIKMRYD